MRHLRQCLLTAAFLILSVVTTIISGAFRPSLSAEAASSIAPVLQRDSIHLTFGNPSGATSEPRNRNNFLIIKPQYALSHNSSLRGPNWVSWHVESDDVTGVAIRRERFRPDPDLPSSHRGATPNDYKGPCPFNRGHMCPAADRSSSQEDLDATFFMTNMLPQTAQLNQGPWERLEVYLRDLVREGNMELYIIAGGTGTLGKIGASNANIPSHTWKVIVILPERNGNDLARVTRETRVIAVSMPNRADIYNARWADYRVKVDEIERVTGLDLLSELDDALEGAIEGRLDREVITQRPKNGGVCGPGRLRPRGRDR